MSKTKVVKPEEREKFEKLKKLLQEKIRKEPEKFKIKVNLKEGAKKEKLPLLQKHAQIIKTVLTEKEHPIKLTHAYEILATICGYRNWNVMSAVETENGYIKKINRINFEKTVNRMNDAIKKLGYTDIEREDCELVLESLASNIVSKEKTQD